MTEADKKFMADFNAKKAAGDKIPPAWMKRYARLRMQERNARLEALSM
tara:strand:- start:40 stop:183 length:144 start_codon:yes stop_codon:yes gene_type:complete